MHCCCICMKVISALDNQLKQHFIEKHQVRTITLKRCNNQAYDIFEETAEGTKLLPRGLKSYVYKDKSTKLHFRCNVCMKTFSSIELLAACMARHKENINLNDAVNCPLCSEKISRKQ